VRRRPADDPQRDVRRRIVRQAAVWTYTFVLSAILVAVGGAALVALLLSFAGLPFVRTWLTVTAALLVAALAMALFDVIRERLGGRR
jgi:uncharacterized membrane protein